MSIYDPVSPTDTYVIYDQFGDFFGKNHLEVPVHGWEQAVDNNYQPSIKEISANDGLTKDSWIEWFRGYDLSKPMAIIHFTNFRY